MSVKLSQHPSTPDFDDIPTLAPTIIDEVAFMLMSDRPHTETDLEIRFGNRGSFSVNKRQGTFYDFEQAVGGGLLDMIMHLCDYEHKSQAVDWLQEKGFIDGTFTPAERTHRPKAQPRTKATGDMFKVGLKLWQEAKPISFYQHHPVRQWCDHRNLFPGYKELPTTIRWHEAKDYIIVALAPIQDFIAQHPAPPEPRQFHLIAIDSLGRKRNAFPHSAPTDDKRTYGRAGITCIALFGDTTADEIAICEGIADALSLTSDFQCVIASITTFDKIKNDSTLVKSLSTKSVYLCGDNDPAGKQAEKRLAHAIGRLGGEIFFIEEPTAKDPAEAARQEGKNERD